MNPFSKVEQPFSFKKVSTPPRVTVGEEIGDISRAMGDCSVVFKNYITAILNIHEAGKISIEKSKPPLRCR